MLFPPKIQKVPVTLSCYRDEYIYPRFHPGWSERPSLATPSAIRIKRLPAAAFGAPSTGR